MTKPPSTHVVTPTYLWDYDTSVYTMVRRRAPATYLLLLDGALCKVAYERAAARVKELVFRKTDMAVAVKDEGRVRSLAGTKGLARENWCDVDA